VGVTAASPEERFQASYAQHPDALTAYVRRCAPASSSLAEAQPVPSEPVSGNIYALADPHCGGTQVEALDANGNVIATHGIPGGP
jgi:hypothetical protein